MITYCAEFNTTLIWRRDGLGDWGVRLKQWRKACFGLTRCRCNDPLFFPGRASTNHMEAAGKSVSVLEDTRIWRENRVADAWLTPKRFSLLVAMFIVALFPGILFGTQSFYFRDYGIFGYPLASYHRECFWRGELPLWNPLNNCGLPHLAQWNTLTLYPLSLIYLLLPLPWSLGLFCLLHLFVAALGMYFLAFSWPNNRLAAAVAGLGFAFNGLTLHCLMWANNIPRLSLMPWVIWPGARGWGE